MSGFFFMIQLPLAVKRNSFYVFNLLVNVKSLKNTSFECSYITHKNNLIHQRFDIGTRLPIFTVILWYITINVKMVRKTASLSSNLLRI